MNVTRIDKKDLVELMNEPIESILTVHYQNLVNTFGQKLVEEFFREMIFREMKKTKKRGA